MPAPSPSRPHTLRRALAAGLTAAGLYVASLGPAGALAQDPTPTATSDPSPTPTQTATAVPTQTAITTPTATPTQTATATPTQTATPTPAATSTPVPSPEPTPEATPTPLPSPTPTPHEVPSEQIDPDGDVPVDDFTDDLDDLTEDPEDAHDPIEVCPRGGKRVGVIVASGADLGDESTGTGRSTSTSARDCKPAKKQTKDRDADHGGHAHGDDEHRANPIRRQDGTPTLDNPTVSLASPGAAPIGVPNFFIEKFRIPPFLLPIYQAAGMQYGVRWEILAAINEIETDYGRNLNISSAGALGWMQFMPATWKAYGVDANKDGLKDPYNPVDAIFAAARYLRAAGAETDLRKAIFAYNHADWYVDSVLLRARLIGGLPSNFVGSLTGLTQARFPVHAKARYAGDLAERGLTRKAQRGTNPAYAIESDASRRGIHIFARRGAPVIAVNDGRILRIGRSERLGRFIQLQDVYGNVFTYGHLAKIARTYPSPRPRTVDERQIAKELELPDADPKPTAAASSTTEADARQVRRGGKRKAARKQSRKAAAAPSKQRMAARPSAKDPLGLAVTKERLYANPARPAARAAGGELQIAEAGYKPTAGAPLVLNKRDYQAKPMRKGARVIAGTILGRIGKTSERYAPHVLFEIRPAGRGAPRIDPKPILDGWKLLESTEIYRAAGRNPFFGPDAETPSIGQILLMSKEALQRRVLANPRIEIYDCGRRDVRIGSIDRRVLATLEFLAASGLKPTVTSLRCGRNGIYTTSGNVSNHVSGNAVDIAAVNGIVITPATQGKGSITEMTIQRLLTLQGTMKPDEIISLMRFDGADNTIAMGDHHDHIHVGWRPLYGTDSRAAKQVNAVLKPQQWIKLIDRLREIDNPTVRRKPSEHALRVKGGDGKRVRASRAHRGE